VVTACRAGTSERKEEEKQRDRVTMRCGPVAAGALRVRNLLEQSQQRCGCGVLVQRLDGDRRIPSDGGGTVLCGGLWEVVWTWFDY